MKAWIDIMRDMEHLMADAERIFDGWVEGGVDGFVIGPLEFHSRKYSSASAPLPATGTPTATYDPDPEVYRRFGVKPPGRPEPAPEARAQLQRTLRAAKERGLSVWIFQAQGGGGPGGSGHYLDDETTMAATCARLVDTMQHYPEADGAVMDGPEWGYEIAPHHQGGRSSIFKDLPESARPLCASLGYDYDALAAARDRLFERLHNLEPRQVALHSPGGFLGGFYLLGADPDLAAWVAFRRQALTRYFQRLSAGVRGGAERPILLGSGPRSAAFAPLCGYDFAALADCLDLLLPKHYFWHRGFDGLVGTVGRWVETLCLWNPGLAEGEGLGVVESLFGLVLPGVSDLTDLETALSHREFFDLVVAQETSRALAAVGDPDRLVPWVDTGRSPHDGDPMPAGDLQHLLEAAATAGLQRFLYHHHGNLTPGEWRVISSLCGQTWDPLKSAYQPPAQHVL